MRCPPSDSWTSNSSAFFLAFFGADFLPVSAFVSTRLRLTCFLSSTSCSGSSTAFNYAINTTKLKLVNTFRLRRVRVLIVFVLVWGSENNFLFKRARNIPAFSSFKKPQQWTIAYHKLKMVFFFTSRGEFFVAFNLQISLINRDRLSALQNGHLYGQG